MKIFLDKFNLPSSKNIVIEDGHFILTNDNLENCDLYFSKRSFENNLNSYLEIFNENPFEVISQNYFNVVKELDIKNPNWKFLLKESDYLKLKSNFKHKLTGLIETLEKIEYSKFFFEGNYILKNLENMSVDTEFIKARVKKEKNPTLKSIISSFIPKEGNVCRKVKYHRMKTTTGRLTVSEGPQILLLPKDMRKSIVSRYGSEGKVVWVDFVSLEPRFTKLLNSHKTEVDIYSDIIENSNLDCSRKKIKLAVLSTLFGAGMKKLVDILEEDAFEVRKSIKKYFELDKVSERIKDYKSGKIKNFFGRNILLKSVASNVALNNYIQSSCVDVSLIGFSSLMKDVDFPESARPIAVVHDALVIDVKNKDLHLLESIINKGITIDGLGKFYLGFESHE